MTTPGETVGDNDPRLHGYRLSDLDRTSHGMNRVFVELDGRGPAGTLVDVYRRQGEAAIMDAGSGTGNQLYSLINEAEDWYGIQMPNATGDAVSDHDFSGMSRNPNVQPAFVWGRLVYRVADLTSADWSPPRLYDLVYSYEVLRHTDDPARIVLNLWKALKEGGVAYFNVDNIQRSAIDQALIYIKSKRGEVLDGVLELPIRESLAEFAGVRPTQAERIYKITKSPTDPWMMANIFGTLATKK